MAVNQPPIDDDPVRSSWDLEITQNINLLEQRFVSLLQAIQDATDLDDLKSRVERL